MLGYIWFGGGQSQLINQAYLSVHFLVQNLRRLLLDKLAYHPRYTTCFRIKQLVN
jgi:hypothetical protein